MGIDSRELKDFPLIEQPFENVEDVQVDQWASTIMDFLPVVVERKIQLVKRPGLTEWINLGTGLPIDGLYWWDRKNCAVAVSGALALASKIRAALNDANSSAVAYSEPGSPNCTLTEPSLLRSSHTSCA